MRETKKWLFLKLSNNFSASFLKTLISKCAERQFGKKFETSTVFECFLTLKEKHISDGLSKPVYTCPIALFWIFSREGFFCQNCRDFESKISSWCYNEWDEIYGSTESIAKSAKQTLWNDYFFNLHAETDRNVSVGVYRENFFMKTSFCQLVGPWYKAVSAAAVLKTKIYEPKNNFFSKFFLEKVFSDRDLMCLSHKSSADSWKRIQPYVSNDS